MRYLFIPAGVVVGVLLALWFSTVVAASGKPSGSVYRDQDYHQRQAKERETREWLSGLKNYPPREAYEPRCDKDSNRDECLLAWRSARAAEIQAKAAIDQVYWSKAGFWFLVFTFGATFAAAVFAYQAARATYRGALADEANAATADATLKVMGVTAERQLRAYMNYAEGNVINFDGTEPPMVQVVIKNFGQTPAYNVRTRLNIWITRTPLNEPFREVDADVQVRGVYGPQSHSVMGRTLNDPAPTDGTREDIRQGRRGLFVFGDIVYDDAFGKERRTTFRLVYGGGEEIRPDGNLATCEEGNTAT